MIVLPAFLLFVWLALQLALWGLAAHAAELAAARGGRAAEAYGSGAGAYGSGRQAAEAVLAGIGSAIRHPVVHVVRQGGSVSVTVSGQVAQVLPWFPLTVSATSAGPSQRFRVSG